MMTGADPQTSWLSTLRAFTHPRVVTLLFLGFSAGIPILLIFSSLSLWLREAGVERAAVTYFSWAALGYSFKFVWAPLVDQIPLPWLSRLIGQRRSWILVSQLAIIVAILLMASINPQAGDYSLTLMALAVVMLGFSSATQDIVIDAYRIESAEADLQALMSATYIAGYRIGMVVAGAGSLYLATSFGSTRGAYEYQAWQYTYAIMAAVMLVGIVTTLIIKEPENKNATVYKSSLSENVRFLLLFLIMVIGFVGSFYLTGDITRSMKSTLAEMINNRHLSGFLIGSLRLALAIGIAATLALVLVKIEFVRYVAVNSSYLMPVKDFFRRYGLSLAWIVLALIGLYRISDIVLGAISNVFYQDMGFTKLEIAAASKTYGLLMTIAGGFAGGLLAVRFGVMRILFVGALLSAVTNLLFMLLVSVGPDIAWLYIVISADNLSGGLAIAAFIAFLSSLTNISFTATQYAIFSSLMTLVPKSIGGFSGSIVDAIGYPAFFLATALMGIPVLFLIIYASRRYRW